MIDSLDGWTKVSLKSLAAAGRASFIDGDWIEAPYITDHGIRLIQTGNIGVGRFIAKNTKHISESSFVELRCKDVFEGDILICRLADPIGRSCIVQNLDERTITSVDVCIFRPDEEKYDKAFISQALNQQQFLDACKERSGGSTRQRISRTNLGLIDLLIPLSRSEQSTIAVVLSAIGLAIDKTEELIAKQERIKAGIVHDLFNAGIDDHGDIRSEKTHLFKDSPLGRIPKEWEVSDIEAISEFVTSGSRGWAKYYSEEGAIFVRIGNLTRDHINLRLDDVVLVNPAQSTEGKRTSVKAGDLLISITADLGIIGVIPTGFEEAYVNQHIALVRLGPEGANPRFIGWYLSSRNGQKQFERLNEAGAKAGLNLPTVRRLHVPLPLPTEQTRIADMLDTTMQTVNAHYYQLNKLRSLKQAIMQDLLTGRKRVTPLLEPEPRYTRMYAE